MKYLIILFSFLTIFSCDDGDDNRRNTDTIEIPDEVNMNLLNGRWNFRGEGVYHDFHPGYNGEVYGTTELACVREGYLELNTSNNTFIQKINYKYNENEQCRTTTRSGTFSVSGKTITLSFTNGAGNIQTKKYDVKRLYENKLEVLEHSIVEENKEIYGVTYYEK